MTSLPALSTAGRSALRHVERFPAWLAKRNRLRQGVMAAADQSLVAPPQPFEEVTVASRSNFPAGPRSGLATSLSEPTNFGVSVCSAKLGLIGSGLMRVAVRRLLAVMLVAAGLFGGTGTSAPTAGALGWGAIAISPTDRQGGAIRRASTRLSRPNWRPSACAKHATAGQS